jgi:flagellar biosynthesis protein FlhB
MKKKISSIKQKGDSMSKQDVAALVGFLAVVLLAIRVLTVANDVQTIIEDTNQANKPREILKLVFDVSSLFR